MHQGRGYLFKVHLSLYFPTAILQTCCSATSVTIDNFDVYKLHIDYKNKRLFSKKEKKGLIEERVLERKFCTCISAI